ncbi:actin-related protein 2/3 complex subunit 2A-like, partial [Apium graveolens]|uniref:actin-related protein 2/3 complex subunit 2A-like n=1 Tax=Apium graveolens TaxID=4045 RepID=UPI003D7B9A34
ISSLSPGLTLSVSFPTPPAETEFDKGLPCGATEAVKEAYGDVVKSFVPPNEGFNLTLELNLSNLPQDKEKRYDILVKIAAVKDLVLGAPLRMILERLASRTLDLDKDKLIALVHRPKECFFLIPREEKVTVIYPMKFEDSIDTVLATSFLQGAEGFMHTRMRHRVDRLIQALDRAKPESEQSEECAENRALVRGGNELLNDYMLIRNQGRSRGSLYEGWSTKRRKLQKFYKKQARSRPKEHVYAPCVRHIMRHPNSAES